MPVDLPKRSVAVVLGTRPEIVKLAGIIRLLGDAAGVIHTGQHFDRTLSDVFFEDLELPEPVDRLEVGGKGRGFQIGEATRQLDEALADPNLRAVVVQGDTNATVAGALAANARELPLVHIEAGLRSFDRRMPEEHNRVVADHLADLCCAPTEVNRTNLAAEGITGDRVALTGNTVVEALTRLIPDAAERSAMLSGLGLDASGFVLATLHRPENVDEAGPLRAVLTELGRFPLPVILPLHPRTAAAVERFGLNDLLQPLRVAAPFGYREFLGLAAESAMLVSDSGGVQEEVSVLKRPVIVVRRSTERPEVLGTFAALVEPGSAISALGLQWLDDLPAVHARLAVLPSPYGDGSASARSVDALQTLVDRS